MTDTDAAQHLAKLVEKNPIAMLTTRDADGHFVSRPMAHQQVEDDADLWFVANQGSRLATHLQHDPHVSVVLADRSTWISIDGEATVSRDVAKAKELWNSQLEAWMPEGPESDDVVLVKVTAHTGEYWDTPGGLVATALSFVKAKTSGEPADVGENEVVDL